MSDFISTVIADLRFGIRQLRRGPSLTVAAILCFALGIGANTSIFSVVDTMLLGIAALATTIPARRAARIDPQTAMHAD